MPSGGMLQLNRRSGVRKAPKQPARRAPKTQGPGGHPSSRPRRAPRQLARPRRALRNKRPWRAPKQPAPQGIQAAGPAGHKKQAVPEGTQGAKRHSGPDGIPKDSGPGRHPRNTRSWEQAACGPGKLSRPETAPIPKKNFPTPDFFLLGPRQSAPLTAAVPAANPFRWPPQRGEPWQAVSPRENLHALAKFGQFCFGRHRLPNETNRRLCQSPS